MRRYLCPRRSSIISERAFGDPFRVGSAWQLVTNNTVRRKNAAMGYSISFDEFEGA
jgi:hypothetical protein